MRDGFFIDVGSAHYRIDSTTYFLEERRGWQGIAIDANGEFAAGYAKERPRTKFFTFFISDKSDTEHPFFVVDRSLFRSSGDKEYLDRRGSKYHEVEVRTITLDDLLTREGVGRIDLLSMDIELGEPAALRGFDIEKWSPRLVCIEMQNESAPTLRDYFAQHGYDELVAYAGVDKVNRYFAPKGGKK